MQTEMIPEGVSFSFDATKDAFFSKHTGYSRISKHEPVEDPTLLITSAVVLELFAGMGCLLELRGASPELPDSQGIIDRTKEQCGIDLVATCQDAIQVIELPPGEPSIPTIDEFLPTARAALELCPVSALQTEAGRIGRPELGHRIRVAYDSIRAFVLRSDPRYQRQIHMAGAKYMQGVLSPSEAASLLGVSVPDAIQVLEDLGYARPVEVMRLDSAERDVMLATIRADRLFRDGEVGFSPSEVNRLVVASERLEGVDARGWLQDKPET